MRASVCVGVRVCMCVWGRGGHISGSCDSAARQAWAACLVCHLEQPGCVVLQLLHLLQADYEDLRNQIEPLSTAVQKLQAERDNLTQQLQQVPITVGCSAGAPTSRLSQTTT